MTKALNTLLRSSASHVQTIEKEFPRYRAIISRGLFKQSIFSLKKENFSTKNKTMGTKSVVIPRFEGLNDYFCFY
jgi:hypothetical protein